MVVLLYVVYCVIAIYGCTGMRKGVAFKKLSNSDSYLEHYYTQKDNLFNQYGPSVALVLHQPLNYSEPQVSCSWGKEEQWGSHAFAHLLQEIGR